LSTLLPFARKCFGGVDFPVQFYFENPDGGRLAYGNVYVYDRAAGTHMRVGAIDDGRVNEIRWSADDGTLIVGVTRWQDAGLWGAIYALPPRPGGAAELLVEGEGVYLLDVVPEVLGVE
jgi:hypothetical protein